MSAKTPRATAARRTLRGAGLGLMALALLLAAAHSLAWRWATGALAVGFSDWVTLRRAEGLTVEHGLPARAGWPFVARLTVPGFRIAGRSPALPQDFAWEAGRLSLTVGPRDAGRLVLEAAGPQGLSLGATPLPYTAARLRAVLPLAPGLPPRGVEVRAERLVAVTQAGPVAARRIDAALAPRPGDGGLALWLSAEALTLPPLPAAAAFGEAIEHLAAEIVLTGPLPSPAPPARWAAAWAAGGGALELSRLALRWGPLAAEAHGTLRLDAALQPAGAGVLALERPQEALAALVGAGLIGAREAGAAGAALALMTRRTGDAPPRAELPLAIGNGRLSVAGAPLLRLGPIRWPSAGAW